VQVNPDTATNTGETRSKSPDSDRKRHLVTGNRTCL
jgi:hypothetical protein